MAKPSATDINKIFYTTPRDGYKSGNLWIKRKEELDLSNLLDGIGISICIDGPTGTGKSSLAITVLKQKKIDFLLVQVTKNMTWKDFCKMLINTKVMETDTMDIGIDTGIDKGLPIFKIHFGIKSDNDPLKALDYEEKIVNKLNDHEICSILKKKELTLIIDDFERASDDILSNVAEMCKLLTLSYISIKTRLVIVGTDDIYLRLTHFNKSLEGRLKEISLGTIDNKHESWNFLNDGLDRLQLKHPRLEYNKNKNYISKEEIQEIKESCFDAADGLLKSLNELGVEIANESTINLRVSKSSILKVCKLYVERNIRRFTQDYPKIFNLIQGNAVIKELVIYLYIKGIGRIHKWDDINVHFENSFDLTQIDNAISQLVEIDFLTRTGYKGEVLFVTNPTLAHTIGAVINNPTKYKAPRSFLTESNQFVLPFLFKNEISEENDLIS